MGKQWLNYFANSSGYTGNFRPDGRLPIADATGQGVNFDVVLARISICEERLQRFTVTEENTNDSKNSGEPVIIKKYANRRLYNTQTSSYVTLDHLCEMVKEGVDFEVRDARTGEDITRSVLTQIIFEEEAKGQNLSAHPFPAPVDPPLRRQPAVLRAGLSRHVDGKLLQEPGSDQKPRGRSLRRRHAGLRSDNTAESRHVRARDEDVLAVRLAAARRASEEPARPANGTAEPKTSEEISELKSEIEAMRKQLSELARERK